MYCVSFRGLSRILALLGCGVGWFTVLAQRGVRGLTTDDDLVYGPALETAGLDRQQCAVNMQRTVGRHIRGIEEDDRPTGTGSCCPSCNAWPGRDRRRRDPSCLPSGRR